ncbi:MAG TPA: NAD(P)-binding domain-containing protein [Polyangia bacterium]|nr:NAD(P)-binding domain-containing protein [Polyangia bacterium]
MRIGMIGAGNVGSTLAELLIRAGHDVTLSHQGSPLELRGLVARLGERAYAGTVEEAARFGDAVVLAIPFGKLGELPREPFTNKIVIDATNYYPERDGDFPELREGRVTSSELTARHLADARIVKAFNSLPMRVLAERARPRGAPDRIALPLSSEFPEAKRVVAQLIDQVGFDPIDLDGLAPGGRLHQNGGPLYGRPLTVDEMRLALGLGGEQPRAS